MPLNLSVHTSLNKISNIRDETLNVAITAFYKHIALSFELLWEGYSWAHSLGSGTSKGLHQEEFFTERSAFKTWSLTMLMSSTF